MKLLLKLMYHGGGYHGFQYQPNALSIQGVLTEKLSDAFGFQCKITGCSRTDAGVHAKGYCCTAEPADLEMAKTLWCTVPDGKLHRFLNIHLPKNIAVIGACRVNDDFHPRYDAISKEYVYLIHDSVSADPFTSDRSYYLKRRLSDEQIDIMNKAASELLGYHDFSAFMAQGSSIVDTHRTLHRLDVKRTGDNEVTITAAADGFLYNMVRILTGTLLDVAAGKITADDMNGILESGDRSLAGFTAPAHGLYLNKVVYDESIIFAAE